MEKSRKARKVKKARKAGIFNSIQPIFYNDNNYIQNLFKIDYIIYNSNNKLYKKSNKVNSTFRIGSSIKLTDSKKYQNNNTDKAKENIKVNNRNLYTK